MTIHRLLAAAAASSCLLAGGCGESHVKRQLSCAAAPSSEGQKVPTVALLAPAGGDPATPSARAHTLDAVVSGAERMKARFLLSAIGTGPDAPDLLVNTRLVAEGANPLMRDNDLECKTASITNGVKHLSAVRAAPVHDIIAALSTLHDDLKTVPHGDVHVVIMGSKLTTTALDASRTLDVGDPGTLADPVRAINSLARAGLNFDCSGWRVSMVGVSAMPDGTSLSGADTSALRRFWKTYFQHCGGTLTAFSNQIAEFPVTHTAIEGADYSEIPVQIRRRGALVKATLDSNVLFATGRHTLTGAAGRTLGKRLRPILRQAVGRIEVVGHTDSTGTEALNQALSRARARTVAGWIERFAGISSDRIMVRGRGARVPVGSNATAAGRARNRRVVVTSRARSAQPSR